MIRNAKTYLVGALSGATLIGIAIAAFVVIVSAQVFHEWPIADTSAHTAKSEVAPAKALTPAGAGAERATATSGATDPALRARAPRAKTGATSGPGRPGPRHAAGVPGATTDATAPAPAAESTPSPSGGRKATSGGNAGSHSSQPPSSSAPPSVSGTTSSGSNSGSGTQDAGPATASGAPSGSGGTGSSGSSVPSTPTAGGEGPTSAPVTAATKPSQTVTEAVNGTVNEVDQSTLGGTLEKTGVTPTTEAAVNGVAGPESAVGGTVDGVGEAVGGVLGTGH